MNQSLWLKFAVVFVYQGLTAVLPLLIAMMSNNPTWTLLIPLLRAGWQTVEKHLTERGLLGSQENGQQNIWH